MTVRGAHPVLAALASVASLLGLTTLVTTQTWFARMVWFVIVAVGVGVVVRRLTSGSAWLVVPAQLFAVVLVATWTYAGSSTWYGLPTLATARRFGVLFAEFGVTAAASSAPMPANLGVEATLALIGVALAILVDFLAVTRAAPAAAGLPLLTAFLAAAANSGSALPPGYFVAAALTWLVLLGRHAQVGMRSWASVAARPMAPVSGSGLSTAPELRFGTIARRLGALGLVAAVALPAVLPHLPPRYLLDGLARSADGRGNAKVGFSSTLDVGLSLSSGGSGRILTYRSSAPSPGPLRVLAATAYDGANWSRPSPTLGRSARLDLADSVTRSERTIIVETNGLEPPALATPQPILTADLSGVSYQVDETTSDVYVQTRPLTYSTTYLEPSLTADLLRNGVDGKAGPDRLPSSRAITTALELDPRSRPAVQAAASAVTAGAETPYDAAVAIQDWLRSKGGFSYTLTLPDAPVGNGVTADPISAFLQTKQGYCVQFASAMIMMARATGIPARMAIGFLPGSQQEGLWTVAAGDAHAWPELYFPGAGWVRFEPTPGIRTGPAPAWTLPTTVPGPAPTSTARPTEDPLDRPDRQAPDLDETTGARTELDVPILDRVTAWLQKLPNLLTLVTVLVVIAALVLPVTAAALRRVRARRGGPPAAIVETHWAQFTSELTDLGISPPPGGTLRDSQTLYARAGYLDEPARESLATVVHSVELARYGRPGTSVPVDIAPLTRSVLHQVVRTRSWRNRVRAIFWPGDARLWWRTVGTTIRTAPGRGWARVRGR